MRRTLKILTLASGTLGGLVLTAATVKPTDVDSNIAAWLSLMHVNNPPTALLTSSADWWGRIFGIVLLLIFVFGLWEWIWPKYRGNAAEPRPVNDQSPWQHLTPAAKAAAISRQNLDAARGQIRRGHPKPQTPSTPRRDTPLADALGYAVTGSWGGVLEDNQMIDDLTVRLSEFEQAARDGEVIVWGKELINGIAFSELWEVIDPPAWKVMRVNWFSVVTDEHAKTEPRPGQVGAAFDQIMVSKAQIEERWPHA